MDRMITLEIAPNSAEDPISWRCLLYGDVLEVVDGEEANAIPKDEREWALYSPKPPAGHHYRQLNPAGTEITVDIMGAWEIAEREIDGQISLGEFILTCWTHLLRLGSRIVDCPSLTMPRGSLRVTRPRPLPV
jgi:hypothetical protein